MQYRARKARAKAFRILHAKKAKNLLLPWLTYSLLIYAVFALMQLVPSIKAILGGSSYEIISPLALVEALLRNENPHCFHLWYLQTLFLLVMCTFLTDKIFGSAWSRKIRIAAILLAPLVYELFCGELCWTVKGFVQKIMFFLAGTFLTDELVRKNAKRFAVIGLPCGILTAFMSISPFVKQLYEIKLLGIALAYFENAVILAFCLGIIGICVIFEHRLERLAAFGRNTMPYYIYHQPFCCAFLGLVLYEVLHLPVLAVVAVCMAAGILIPYIITRLATVLRLKKLFDIIGLPT